MERTCCNCGDICRLLFLTPSFFMAILVPIMVLWWFHLSFFCFPSLATVSLLFLSKETSARYFLQFHICPNDVLWTLWSACDPRQVVVTHCLKTHPNLHSLYCVNINDEIRDQTFLYGGVCRPLRPKWASGENMVKKLISGQISNNGYIWAKRWIFGENNGFLVS